MRKLIVGAVLVASAVVMAGSGFAGAGPGPGGCDRVDCPKAGAGSEEWRKFRTESLDLRKQLMDKRYEREKESLQQVPDQEKVARLDKEIAALQDNLRELRAKSGVGCDQAGMGCGGGR